MHRWLSRPLLDLLRTSSSTAEDIDATLNAMAGRVNVAKLYPGHAAIDDLRRATGLNVVEIGRRHGRLLVKIEELTTPRLGWAYREGSLNNCIFTCPGIIPEVRKMTRIGRPLSTVAEPHPALNDVRIIAITDSTDGWSEIQVDPGWFPF